MLVHLSSSLASLSRFLLKKQSYFLQYMFLLFLIPSYYIRAVAARCCCGEQLRRLPHVQDQRNPSKTVGTEEGLRGQANWNHNHRKLANLITWTTALSNTMKLWAMPRRVTQGRRVTVESSDKTWSTGEGNGKPLVFLHWEPHEQYEKVKRNDTERWTSQVSRCPICYWRRLEKYLQREWRYGAKVKITPSCGCH